MLHFFADRLQNLVSGLGGSKDKRFANAFALNVLTAAELSAMHRSDWLARKIVDIIPHDMTREWRNWQAEDDQIEALEEVERLFGVRHKVTEALQKARLYGGSALVMGIDGNPEEPLDPERVGQGALRYLTVLHRYEIGVEELDRDVLSPFYREPRVYTVSGERASVRVHPSRVIRFCGAPIMDIQQAADGWGDSVLQVVYDAIQNAASSQEYIAALLPEAKLDVIHVPDLSASLATAESTSRLKSRFQSAAQLKSMFNMLLLEGDGTAGEKWQQKTINFAQFPELMRLFLQVAAGAADIPVTRLLGQAPAGLNATGESDIRNYYDNVAARQEIELRPALARLDEVLVRSALGSRPDEVYYEWAPLWQIDEAQRSEIFKRKAEGVQIYVNSGIVPEDALGRAVCNMLIEDGALPGFEAALEEAQQTPEELALEEPEPEPDDESQGGLKVE